MPLVGVLGVICLLIPPLALVTNIVAVCRDKSKVLGAIGLAISIATCLLWGLWLLAFLSFR